MAIIKRSVKLKIDTINVELKALTFEQKQEINTLLMGGKTSDLAGAIKLSVKYGIKSMSGLENEDGSEYQVVFDENGMVDECFDDISNIEESNKIQTVCMSLLQGLPKEFVDAETGKKLEGVEVLKKDSAEKK